MRISRLLVGLLFWLTSITAFASIHSSPVLTNAEKLLETSPAQSLEISNRFLAQRRLTTGANRSHVNNDTDRSIRTPLHTVYAYLISARAYAYLDQPIEAKAALQKAYQVVDEYDLKHVNVQVLLTEASLIWHLERDSTRALAILDAAQKAIETLPESSLNGQASRFKSALLRANILAATADSETALVAYENARSQLNSDPQDLRDKVEFQLSLGGFLLDQKQHESALTELLSAFWIASENEYTALIADANMKLAKLYNQQGVLNQALEHANQAAAFFEHFSLSRRLSASQRLLATIYEQQARYNFALVHYFNALEIEQALGRLQPLAQVHLAIARTYYQLEHFPLSDRYIQDALRLVGSLPNSPLTTQAMLLQGRIHLALSQPKQAEKEIRTALERAEVEKDHQTMTMAHHALSRALESQGKYQAALMMQRDYEKLRAQQTQSEQQQQADTFKQQQRVVERQLQMDELQRQLDSAHQEQLHLQKVNYFLLGSLGVLVAIVYLRHRAAVMRQVELEELRDDFYTHPRTGLRNLRMLNAKLPRSLEKSNANFEQWYLNDMIHQPLSDRLRFAMFDVALLKALFLRLGYQRAQDIERQLGDYLSDRVTQSGRLYHFADTLFIYIETNWDQDTQPDALAHFVQSLIADFVSHYQSSQPQAVSEGDQPPALTPQVAIGLAEYPFLPRAYTSINDQELIEILLTATHQASDLAQQTGESHWVHFSAINTAPAASFVNTNLRHACLKGIDSGLVKVKSSANDLLNWQKDHESDKKPSSVIDDRSNKSV
ncbi:tetratricopeptide repeat protein [Salinivibrio kushneri]|uniref:GGDEF domain-containing protein n=1 Tax=Salinivibrio kushneri TaxID=1908198 RepID=A0AA47LRW5_9GAMM|nr:GGDEF domain-containing protein [Salinivibrio kushneri]WBA09210.1 GGDEF domain-containing protein [Salinivibrio kushneri]